MSVTVFLDGTAVAERYCRPAGPVPTWRTEVDFHFGEWFHQCSTAKWSLTAWLCLYGSPLLNSILVKMNMCRQLAHSRRKRSNHPVQMIRQQYTDADTIPQHRCKPVSISASAHHFCYIDESVSHCQRFKRQTQMQSKIVLWRYCPRHTVENCLLEIDALVSPQPQSFRLVGQFFKLAR
ncbi:hypothetical protein T05_8515 [Trichinella murrelli]|uniref:Uncharacterized protein n=1 Tax=Trichinella murrelli TaxID=144512 RepID=A0A0V0UCV8_9BILA|nr:hypothetical protein T05_8515 [Trichinella murrelli]